MDKKELRYPVNTRKKTVGKVKSTRAKELEAKVASPRPGRPIDISGVRQAVEALRISESSSLAVLQSMDDGTLAIGSKDEVLFANERFAEIWRIPQTVMASKDDPVLLQYVLDQMSDPQSFLKRSRSYINRKKKVSIR